MCILAASLILSNPPLAALSDLILWGNVLPSGAVERALGCMLGKKKYGLPTR